MGETDLPLPKAEVKELCKEPDAATKGFILQQTSYRIKDPRITLPFYTKVLGMRLLQRLDNPNTKCTLYYLGFEDAAEIPATHEAKTAWALSRRATLELTHNWGTENDQNLKFHDGNTEPRGFGHIGLNVPNVKVACAWFDKCGVEYAKRPEEEPMTGLAYIKDPDGYWIEVLNNRDVSKCAKEM